jgi:GNAT superfamily N-acetyltransferase
MEVRRVRYDDPAVRELTDALATELLARYEGRAGSGGEPGTADFDPPGGAFLLALDEGRAGACGGLCRYDERTGEIRRMYVVPDARGRGISRLVLAALEAEAKDLGYGAVRLETGTASPKRSACTEAPASSRSRASGRTSTTSGAAASRSG